jgi:hypothetical protein
MTGHFDQELMVNLLTRPESSPIELLKDGGCVLALVLCEGKLRFARLPTTVTSKD